MPADPLSTFLTDTLARFEQAAAKEPDLGVDYWNSRVAQASVLALPTALKIIAELAKDLALVRDEADAKAFSAQKGSDMEFYCAKFATLLTAALARANDLARGKHEA